jgi:ubiquinol-cytochrome c reductase iron-sulfur subunit
MSETSLLPDDPSRRNALVATCAAGAVGGAAVAWPFLKSLKPSERALAAGAPVWVVRRTPEMLESLKKTEPQLADPASDRKDYPTPDYAKNGHRSIKPEFLVVVGICSHLGCSPVEKFTPGPQASLPDDWAGGFLCPCHGSTFDFAGRVFKNKPAPDNLEVPPHTYLSDTRLLIGEDKKA